MKNAPLNNLRSLTIVFAICALAMLCTHVAFAQGGQDSATANSPARCLGGQLSLREAEGEADMGGKRYGNYVFTNASASPCTLSGFPRFVLLNKSGRPLRGVKVENSEGHVSGDTNSTRMGDAPQTVTLEPGKTAWFQIFYNDGMAIEHKRPFPVSARVRIIAPGTKRVFILRQRIQPCCGARRPARYRRRRRKIEDVKRRTFLRASGDRKIRLSCHLSRLFSAGRAANDCIATIPLHILDRIPLAWKIPSSDRRHWKERCSLRETRE
jgi:Domain of unknown function (DUF4232)